MRKTKSKNHNAQVALEFLVTYGWAILASMIAIGALAYFGISNPAKTLPDKCLFSNNFICNDYIITAPDQVRIKISNGAGQTIYDPSATLFNTSASTFPCNVVGNPSDWAPDDIIEMNCTMVGGSFISKDKVRVRVTLNYKKTVGGFNQISTGELYTTVQ